MKTILLVEDEPGLAAALAACLRDDGFQVLTAGSGERGLALVADQKPDLILADIMMPHMDGFEFSLAFRADEDFADIPIVLMSGIPESVACRWFDGYSRYLHKPFRLAALTATINDVLS